MSLSRGLAERAIKLELQHPGHEVPAKYKRKPINSSLIRLTRQREPPRSLMERRIVPTNVIREFLFSVLHLFN